MTCRSVLVNYGNKSKFGLWLTLEKFRNGKRWGRGGGKWHQRNILRLTRNNSVTHNNSLAATKLLKAPRIITGATKYCLLEAIFCDKNTKVRRSHKLEWGLGCHETAIHVKSDLETQQKLSPLNSIVQSETTSFRWLSNPKEKDLSKLEKDVSLVCSNADQKQAPVKNWIAISNGESAPTDEQST